MKFLEQKVDIISKTIQPERTIERMGKICTASESTINENSHIKFIDNLIKNGHTSVLEHAFVSLRIQTSIKIAAQLRTHRFLKEIVAFSQQSTRYCCFAKEKFGGEIAVIRPHKVDFNTLGFTIWHNSCLLAETSYFKLLEDGWKPEAASFVLPESTATILGITANCNAWRHYLKTRLDFHAQIDHRHLAGLILDQLLLICPAVFADLKKESENGK